MVVQRSSLDKHREHIDNLIEPISKLIGFEISVIDHNLQRISGTGIYKDYIGYSLPFSSANSYVLNSKKFMIISKPLHENVCIDCSLRKLCPKDLSIIAPIFSNNQVIGTVSVAVFENNKKDIFLNSKEILRRMIINLSEQISLFIDKQEGNNIVDFIFNNLNEGIILTDDNGLIISTNNFFNDSEIIEGSNIKEFLSEKDLNEVLDGRSEQKTFYCSLKFKRTEIFLCINVKKITSMLNDRPQYVFIFTEENRNGDYGVVNFVNNNLSKIIGNSKKILELKELILKSADSDSNVLIQGESGTGKELIARALHQGSSRSDKPFIAINCAAIPEHLIETELFGYEGGAFTSAKKEGKEGKFELAHGGTIFLDEIGDLPLHLQPKLLRVLEYGEFERVGGIHKKFINARIISATNLDLEEMIENKEFRKDLFYRLNVINIISPSLRNRKEDILTLSCYFLNKKSRKRNKKITSFSSDVEKVLLSYDWPGNIRELENTIEYLCNIEVSEEVQFSSLPKKLQESSMCFLSINKNDRSDAEIYKIKQLELKYGKSLLSKKKIAKELGISLSTLYRRLNIR